MKRITAFILTGLVMTALCGAQATVNSAAFRQEGIASWYGNEFDGRLTASGEVFKTALFTAAHPTLPFGTLLLVTNIQNNKQVVVRVNDRGPFVAGRIIDLSKAAAERLDMLLTGTAPVIVELTNLPAGYYGETLGPIPMAAPVTTQSIAPVSTLPPVTYELPLSTSAPVLPPISAPAPAQTPMYIPIPAPVVQPAPQPVPVVPAAPVSQPVPAAPVTQPVPVVPAAQVPQPAPQPAPVVPAVPVIPPPVSYAPVRQSEPEVTPPAPEPAPVPAPVSQPVTVSKNAAVIKPAMPAPGSGRVYRIQAGSYKVARNAVEAFDKLKGAGLNPAYEKSGDLYRVVLGGIKADEVPLVAERLGAAGFQEVLIREEP